MSPVGPNWVGPGVFGAGAGGGGAGGTAIYNVKSYGAKGDGVTDDTAAIQSAVTALTTGGLLVFPPGQYVVDGTVTVTTPVSLIGSGTSTDWFNTSDAPWKPATEWLRASAATVPFLKIGNGTSPVGGVRVEGIAFDGATHAGTVIVATQMQGCVLRDLSARRFTGYGLVMGTASATANVGTLQNRIDNVHLRGANGVTMTGNATHTADCAHNLFTGLLCQFSGTRGILLTAADNNTFVETRLYREAGTGIGMELGARARANYFFHLEPSSGGVQVDTPATAGKSNLIVGYDVENGEPLPTFQTGAFLDYTVTGVASSWLVDSYWLAPAKSVKVTAAHNVQPTESIIYATGTFTVSPPSVLRAGRVYTVKNIGAGTVTVGSGGHNIEGVASYVLGAQYSFVTVQYDGTTFHVVASGGLGKATSFISANVTLTATTAKTVTTVSLVAGTWLVTGQALVKSASTARHYEIALTTTANSMASALGGAAAETAAVTSENISLDFACIVTPTATTTYHLNAEVNGATGAVLAAATYVTTHVVSGLVAVRIA